VAASEEHDLAAAEFATAARDSSDPETIRIMTLLEQHHKKLGEILKNAHEKPLLDDVDKADAVASDAVKQSPESATQPPRLPRAGRSATRDLSSSIASNLATARGIPSNRQKRSTPVSPLVSNQHADGHIASDTTRISPRPQSPARASKASRPSWTPPMAAPEESTTSQESVDSPFHQFYHTFEGLVSKMSAPLAFAGLPLAQPAQVKEPDPQVKAKTKPSATPSKPPRMDYSHLISNAAFRAVSALPDNPGPASGKVEDSFYYVPTAGGTMSYAEMVNRADREEARTLRGHHRQISNLSNISEDDFVDAPSEQPSKPIRRGMTNERKVDSKTMEELALENQALKHITDTLSRRLHVFEMSSQTSTAALAQSIRSLPRSPVMTPTTSRNKAKQPATKGPSVASTSEEPASDRIAELEEILRKSDARVKKKDAENEKLRATVERYRDKWDNLKAGAKARRERQQGDTPGGRRPSETIVEEAGEG
jgi:hypothetical protein